MSLELLKSKIDRTLIESQRGIEVDVQMSVDCVSSSYGAFHPADLEQIHSIGVSVALNGLWDLDSDLLQTLDIDIFSHGNPAQAGKILNRQ